VGSPYPLTVFANPEGNNMAPHQQRVVTEKEELDEKLAKLKAFLDDAEKERLQRQADHMNAYSGVLGERIAEF